MATINDFGLKVGGAAKDRAAARGTVVQVPRRAPRKRSAMRFDWYVDTQTRAIFVCKRGDRARRRVMEFADRSAAMEFRRSEESQALLEGAWEALRDSTNVTEDSVRGSTNRPRSGRDHRGGVDANPELFMSMFAPYGVEFGNWQRDRVACLNQTTDALLDLAEVVRWSPSELLFGRSLSLAFGARGHGKAAAHYEPMRRVINLTKTAGAGCLAHEWFHAFDHDAAGLFGGYASELAGHAVCEGFRGLPRGLITRSYAADRTRSGAYWSQPREIMARAFEAWVRACVDNDYLANITPAGAFSRGDERYPYPLTDEMPAVDAVFRRIFNHLDLD